MPRFNELNPLGIIVKAQELPAKKDPTFSDTELAVLIKVLDIAAQDSDVCLNVLRDKLFQVIGNWDTGCKFKIVGEEAT